MKYKNRMKSKAISILDTDITSSNLGNEIIMESVYYVLNDLFPNDFMIKLQCTDYIGPMSKKYIGLSDFSFIGGSNLLTSQMNKYKQIGFAIKDSLAINDMILMGVGWWQYQDPPNLVSKFFLKNLLSSKVIHSVRDEYTKKRLNGIGVTNVLNTSCPSTWSLTEEHCQKITIHKSQNVVFTITDYNHDLESDQNFINLLQDNYDTVYFWPQGLNDIRYLEALDVQYKDRIEIIPPKLQAFDQLLLNNNIDYIGTRLHGGIRAIQRNRRALVLAIDNRAHEISSDIGLNVSDRDSISDLQSFIHNKYQTLITIPKENIAIWKDQFQ
jgi:polysaccharide pyruvyl transferase WcaK-like protein